MAKEYLINRAKYKIIKRYDHHQMECFARSLYETGLKDGAAQAESGRQQIDMDELEEKLLQAKGIGSVKAKQIIQIIKEMTL